MKNFSLLLLTLLWVTGGLFAQTPDQIEITDEAKRKAVERILEEKFRFPENFTPPEYTLTPAAKAAGLNETKLSTLTGSGVSEAEPFIAIDPTDSNRIVVSYMENGASGLEFPIFISTDAGISWNRSSFDPLSIAVADFPGLQVGGGGDPVFAFDNNGKLYFSWLYLFLDFSSLSGKMAMYWSYSNDGGQTFTVVADSNRFIGYGNLVLLTQPGADGDGIHDRQWMAVDRSGGQYDGNLYLSMLFVPGTNPGINGSGMIVKTKEAQYDSISRVNAVVAPQTEVQFGNVAVDGNGNVHCTYGDLNAKTINHSISTDGGATFSTPATIAVCTELNGNQFGTGRVHNRENASPNLFADENSDNLYVVYTDLLPNATQAYLVYSTNSGTTWSLPFDLSRLVNDPAVTQAFMPSVAVDQNGNVSVTFWGLDANDLGHFYASESKDGGATWEPARQITSVETDFASYSGSQAFFGDYQTAVKYSCNTYSVWADGRNASGPKMYFGCTDHCLAVGVPELTPITDQITVGNPFPNPGHEQLEIAIELRETGTLEFSLLDLSGKEVLELGPKRVAKGPHELSWTLPTDLAGGWYLLQISSPWGRITRKWMKSE